MAIWYNIHLLCNNRYLKRSKPSVNERNYQQWAFSAKNGHFSKRRPLFGSVWCGGVKKCLKCTCVDKRYSRYVQTYIIIILTQQWPFMVQKLKFWPKNGHFWPKNCHFWPKNRHFWSKNGYFGPKIPIFDSKIAIYGPKMAILAQKWPF